MQHIKKRLSLVGILFIFSTYLYAQEEVGPGEMITDRPDETEAPSLVPKGFLQVETGFQYEALEDDFWEQKNFKYNTTLVRYGLLDNLELRLGTDYLNSETSYSGVQEMKRSGFVPLLVGAKIGIAEENGLLPQIGFMGHLMMPFGASSEFKPETTGVDFRFAFTHSLTEGSDFSYNLGAKWHDDATEATYIYTLSYGYDITDRLGIYAELYGDLPEDSSAEHNWDAGLTFLIMENLQLDVLAGTGINTNQKIMFGGGVSFRVPR